MFKGLAVVVGVLVAAIVIAALVLKLIFALLPLLAVAAVALLIYAATRPDAFRIERSVTVAAPAERVFPELVDFRRWAAWSPWEKLDPAMAKTYGGAESGVGATYAWESPKAGSGRMAIVEASAFSKVVIELDFVKPFEAHNLATFALVPEAGGTRVSWAMEGRLPYLMKLMGVFFDQDKVVGKDFEAGLASLKAIAEEA